MLISIADLPKARVLAVLYNASRPTGLGFTQYDPTPMAEAEAQAMLESRGVRPTNQGGFTPVARVDFRPDEGSVGIGLWFDRIKGRALKINLEGEEIDAAEYDRANAAGVYNDMPDDGSGFAEAVISELRRTGEVNPVAIDFMHKFGTAKAHEDLRQLRERMSNQTAAAPSTN